MSTPRLHGIFAYRRKCLTETLRKLNSLSVADTFLFDSKMKILLVFLLALVAPAFAAEPIPLTATLKLTHTAKDSWRADFEFSEPVEKLELSETGTAYRQQAWHIRTPGVTLQRRGDEELLVASEPVRKISVDVDLFLPFGEKSYTPMDRFSDGGTDVYLGFFDGRAIVGGKPRPLLIRFALQPLPGEHALAPPDNPLLPDMYAYFGPSEAKQGGASKLIIDPATPAWAQEVLRTTTERVSAFYTQSLGRPLTFSPLVMVAMGDLTRPGYSLKGGAIGYQVVYRMEGAQVTIDTPDVRAHLAHIVAHELAHVWQSSVKQGGIGEGPAWVHEGGAEALATAALRDSGIVSAEQSSAMVRKLVAECTSLKESTDGYRGIYSCGFKRHVDSGIAPEVLWRRMMNLSEQSGQTYSPAMFEQAVRQ